MKNKLQLLNISVFLQTQLFMLPFLFLFYQHCGLGVGDFFLFQGIFSLTALLLEIPMGYLGDIFSKRNILILSYSFFVLRCLLWLFFSQYGYFILLLGEILYAAQKASFAGTSDSYIYEYLKRYNVPQKMKQQYGRMNFFMSFGTAFSSVVGAWIYAIVSKYTLQKYNYNYGFVALIGLELILNLIAICLLLRLPKIPQQKGNKMTLKRIYADLFQCIVSTMKNKNIKYHILYSGIIAATTVVFAWSFQPIMKMLLIPVSLYGLVYFINHFFRAMASFYSDEINKFVPLSKIALSVFVLFTLCFISTFVILNVSAVPTYVSFLYFGFVSFSIGVQLTYLLLHVSRLHTFIPSNMRATSSSVNSLIGRLYAGFFFILMKILLDGVSIQQSLAVCFVLFIIGSWPLRKVYSIQLREEEHD